MDEVNNKNRKRSANIHILDITITGICGLFFSTKTHENAPVGTKSEWTSLAVIVLRAEWSSTGIDHHWSALLFAPDVSRKCAASGKSDWTSSAVIVLLAVILYSQLGSTIIGQHWYSRQVNLSKSPVSQLCLNLIGCHCFARRVILNCDWPSVDSIVFRARWT